jgi:hypothetical protein
MYIAGGSLMIIKFKLDDYYDICDEYEEIFEQEDVVDVEDGDEDCLVVRTRRIVIPAIHASFREAEWLSKNPDAKVDKDEWENQCSVIVHYEEEERNPAKFISYATCDLLYFAKGLCDKIGIDPCNIAQLDCYIDTSEFIDE